MEFVIAPAGRPTTLAVRKAIDFAKQGEPLQPVRVIVSSNLAGLSLRRVLGSVDLAADASPGGGSLAGIANVQFSTPFQFASLLAAPLLAARGLRPLTTSVLAAAVRHVLANDPGRFGAVATHVATETALIRAYGEITEMTPDRRALLAQSSTPRTQQLLAFVDAVGKVLETGTGTRYHDEYTVLRSAIDVARSSSEDGVRGPTELRDRLVLVGPFTQGVATIEFLADLVSASVEPVAVWANTGDADVDGAALSQAQTIFGAGVTQGSTPGAAAVPTPTVLTPTADTDEEVREVVRSILASAENGQRFDRMAVFVPTTNPYMRTVREQLDRAGIPSAGPEYRTLADSMTGRLVTSLLELSNVSGTATIDQRFSREDVLALVNSAPLRGKDGRPLRSGSWENISRRAGVIGGLEGWESPLFVHGESIEKRLEENPNLSEGYVASKRNEVRSAAALADFVGWLGELTAPNVTGRTWSERAQWVRATLERLLPPENRRSRWPESEIDAAQRIDRTLSRIGVLDDIEPNPTPASFLRAVQLELDVPAGRRGRFGTGVLVAPLASAIGLDLDEIYILGLSEGVCPRPIREDTLIPDEEREATAGGLLTRSDRNREERQRYLHALASGSMSSTLLMPRGDHRTGRQRTASRWWIEAMRRISGDPLINSQNWSSSSLVADHRRGSFSESLTRSVEAGIATSVADLQLHHLHAKSHWGTEFSDDVLASPVRRGLQMTKDRLSGFNRFNGDLSGVELSSPASDGNAVSPSMLETWAGCPRRYFLGRVLELGEVERPEEITEISALDRGSLVHSILEDFIRGSIGEGGHTLTDPEEKWTEADRDRLFEIAEKYFREYEELNRTGKKILWEIRKAETLADLETFLRADEELRASKRTVPLEVEMPFGMGHRYDDSVDAAQVELDDGRTVGLRGLIDRVDQRNDGTPVVLDYKTSKAASQKRFDEDPVLGGTKLQLGAYAYAAKQHLGTETAHAYYWYTSSKGEFKHAGYPWGAPQDDRFRGAVSTIIRGIESGQFPPNPGDYNSFYGTFENCSWCPFERLCPGDRNEEFEVAVQEGRLVEYVAMVDNQQDESGNEGEES